MAETGNPQPVIDEAIYLAVDHQDADHYVLITGLAITRNPGRFTPIAPLHGVGARISGDPSPAP